MKMTVFSDCHGNTALCEKIINDNGDSDLFCFCGDGTKGVVEVFKNHPDKKLKYVAGNCDVYGGFPSEEIFDFGGLKFLLMHGDHWGVKCGLMELEVYAAAQNIDIVLYGHTHIAEILNVEGITYINPGALRYPASKGKSYCNITVNEDKSFNAEIIPLD